jgi:tetratricopeptide (TPR) repeat protein
MAKRRGPRSGSVSRQLAESLSEVNELTKRKRWVEARAMLYELDLRFSNNPAILHELVNVNFELHDIKEYERYCAQLIQFQPDNPDLMIALAGAYLTNLRPALGLDTFRKFLARYPNHPRASEIRDDVAEIEAKMDDILGELGLTGDDRLEIALLHERVLTLSQYGKYAQARQVAQQLLARQPNFTAALNNVSHCYVAEGQLAAATTTARRVIEIDPENFHALGNLARFLCMQGDTAQARVYAERLKALQSPKLDLWTKKAETCSFLGDDQGVLDALAEAEREEEQAGYFADPMLYHLAAVAAWNLGNEDTARDYWRRALKLAPGLRIAQDNLDDLRQLIEERHAPWAFSINEYVSRQTIADLSRLLKPASKHGDKGVTQSARRFLQQHPEMNGLVPLLLERGDPQGREFALGLVEMAETPELLAALRDFALGQRGPDAMRIQAARKVLQVGLIPAGNVCMWSRGQWSELMLIDFDISAEPTVPRHSKPVSDLLITALAALRERKAALAEDTLRQALTLDPDAPDLYNNLAVALEQQNRLPESAVIMQQVLEQHPDYAFARIGLARGQLLLGEIDRAEELLKPLFQRKKWNIDEFVAFCSTQIDLAVQRKLPEVARSWLGMWENIDPESPELAEWRVKLGIANLRQRLLGRWSNER